VRPYAQLGADIEQAFRAYAEDVRAGRFPGPEQCYHLDPADEAEIREARERLSREQPVAGERRRRR